MTQCYHIFSSQCFTCLFFLITFHQKNRITSQRINPQRRRSVNHIIRLTHLIIRKQCFFRGIYSISIIKINNFVTVISYIPRKLSNQSFVSNTFIFTPNSKPLFSSIPILRFNVVYPVEDGIGTSNNACSVRRLYQLASKVIRSNRPILIPHQ